MLEQPKINNSIQSINNIIQNESNQLEDQDFLRDLEKKYPMPVHLTFKPIKNKIANFDQSLQLQKSQKK